MSEKVFILIIPETVTDVSAWNSVAGVAGKYGSALYVHTKDIYSYPNAIVETVTSNVPPTPDRRISTRNEVEFED